jgi:periplasmic copper chaperone A
MTGRFVGPHRPLAVMGAIASMVLFAAAATAENIVAENAWVPWVPPAVKVQAAYLMLVNRGDSDQYIIGAESPDYQRVELHASSLENGLSVMRPVDKVAIAAHGRMAFEPGGLHVMLIGPKRSYAVDDRIQIALHLRGGEEVQVIAVVRRHDSGAHDHQSHGGAH